MKKLFLIIFSLILSLSLICCFACSGENKKVELVEWENATDTVEYGAEYSLKKYVYDKKGKAYNVKSTVFVGDKELKPTDYVFSVTENTMHTIVYSTSATEETITVKLTVTPRIDTDFYFADESEGISLTSEDVKSLNFSGNYKGEANKYQFDVTKNNITKIKFDYTIGDLEEKRAEGYTNMSCYVALNSENEKAVRLLCSETSNKLGQFLSQDYTPYLNTWQKVTISIDDIEKLMFDTEGIKKDNVEAFSVYMAQGKRSIVTIYLSEVVFDESTRIYPVVKGEIAFVNNDADVVNFANAAASGDFALATEDQLAGISGEYKGNAVVANVTSEYCMPKIYPRIAEEDWDKAIENGYSKMYVWVAVVLSNDVQKINVNNEAIATSGVLKRSGDAHSGTINVKTWTKFTFDLTEENKVKMFDANGARLIQLYYWQRPIDVTYEVFVGNVGFDSDTLNFPIQEGEIAYINNANDIVNFANAADSGNFTLATEDQLAGISGEYKGNAVVANITGEYCVPKIYPRIAEEDWDKAIENGYSKMYVWVAVVLSNDVQRINVNNENIAISGVLQRSGDAHSGYINVKTWTKFTFDLTEENKAKMFDANGAKLIQLYYWQRPTDVTYEVFVGNVGFDEETKVSLT